jgi:copper(I)-binding protein
MKVSTSVRFALPLVGLLALAGCGSSTDTATTGSPATGGATSAPAAAAAVTLSDGWVKAAPSGMTGMFGTVKNTTGKEITIVGGSSEVAGMIEMHEVVMVDGVSKMQPKAGGFMIPAGGEHTLAPGHDHVMLVNLKQAVKPGDQITVTLKLSDGSTATVSGIAKEFAAGNESYKPSGTASMSGMSGGAPS